MLFFVKSRGREHTLFCQGCKNKTHMESEKMWCERKNDEIEMEECSWGNVWRDHKPNVGEFTAMKWLKIEMEKCSWGDVRSLKNFNNHTQTKKRFWLSGLNFTKKKRKFGYQMHADGIMECENLKWSKKCGTHGITKVVNNCYAYNLVCGDIVV